MNSKKTMMKNFLPKLTACTSMLIAVSPINGQYIAVKEGTDVIRQDNRELKIAKISSNPIIKSKEKKIIKQSGASSELSMEDVLGLYKWEYYNAFKDPEYGGLQTTNLQFVKSEDPTKVDIYGYP